MQLRNYLHNTPWLLKKFYPGFTWDMNAEDGEIFLTFDDGPIPGPTDFVLEQLEKYQAKATFFCVGGNLEKYPELATSVLSAGHTIGNHTFSHLNGWKTSSAQYVEDVANCEQVLRSIDSKSPGLFRPPYGRISKSQGRAIGVDKRIIMWDYLVGDFDQSLNSDICLQRAIKNIRSGSIVVFHDSVKAFGTLEKVLPTYLENLSQRGFKCLPLD